MREIKFRAWHKEEQKIFPVLGTMKDLVALDLGDECATFVVVDGLELMQYTGLKDKAGTEIWEGDIVRIPDIGSKGNLYQVVWEHDRWGLDDKYGHSYDSGDYYSGHEVSWDEAEVVGNVYERPELLKEGHH